MSEIRMPSYYRSSMNQRQLSGDIRDHADGRYGAYSVEKLPLAAGLNY